MKTLIVTALLLANSAFATSMRINQTEILPHVTIDGQESNLVGVINLNFIEKNIEVNLYSDPCGSMTAEPGTIHCMAAAMLKHSYKTPMQAETNSCGSFRYYGVKDMRMVDGPRVSIEAIDHFHRICDDVQVTAFDVNVEVLIPRSNTARKIHLMK